MQNWLQDFEKQQGIRVRLQLIAWDVAWSRLVEFALSHHGPDVSQIGNIWV